MASVTLSSGQCWELGEQIGKGGAGQVFAATCDGTSVPHVIKLVPNVAGAQREVFVTRGLQARTNVVPVLDTGKTDTHLALLMPKAEKSLRKHLIDARGPLPEATARTILTHIARGLVSLTGLHVPGEPAPGIVHRDLKPDNVLLLDGAWCISDFSIARYLNSGTALDTRRYAMTQEYAAPEQFIGETAVAETDVYAFGVMAFELLMGRRPFTGPDFRLQHLNAQMPAMSTVSPRLTNIIVECLYKVAGSRPTPESLLRRLTSLEGPASTVTGLGALHAANLAEAGRVGVVTQGDLAGQGEARTHRDLLSIAAQQWQAVSYALHDTILEAAPLCQQISSDGYAWRIQLGQASMSFSEFSEQQATTRLPFDVRAYASISLWLDGEEVRAHSLWFCNATAEGRHLWYETAFVKEPNNNVFIASGGLESSVAKICAYAPTDEAVVTALLEGSGGWPFTPIPTDDFDFFIGRWATWFGEAAQGIRSPVVMPNRSEWLRQVSLVGRYATAQDQQIRRESEAREAAAHPEVSREASQVIQQLGYGAHDGTVEAVDVASHLGIALREAVCRELRTRLRIRQSPQLIFKRRADKQFGLTTAPGELMERAKARFSPLKLLDGTRYEEFIFVSEQEGRIVLVERRAPSKQGCGRLLYAFLVMVSEVTGALQQGRPSPSLQAWLSGPEMIAPDVGISDTPALRPYTFEDALAAFDSAMGAHGTIPQLSGQMPLNDVQLAPGAGGQPGRTYEADELPTLPSEGRGAQILEPPPGTPPLPPPSSRPGKRRLPPS